MRRAWPLALLGLVLIWGPSASAHANLLSSAPAGGATWSQAPTEVTLRFSEQPEPSLSQVQVLTASGSRVDRGLLQQVPGDAHAVLVPVRKLADGIYTVAWRTVSRVDGHATAGAFAFGVGVSAKGAEPSAPTAQTVRPEPAEVAGRWLFIIGIAAALGGAIVSRIALRAPEPSVASLVIIGCFAALVGVGFLAIAQHRATGGAAWTDLLATSIGRALVWRTVAVAIALTAGLALRRRLIGSVVVASACFVAITIEAGAGHAAAAATAWPQIAAQVAHFAAAAAWIGGLGAVLLAVRGTESDEKARVISTYSKIAGISLAVVVATGAFRAVSTIGSFHALFTTSYGRVVMIKDALLFVLASLGARQRYRNVPNASHDLGGIRRVGRTEIAVATVIFVATAVLTGLSPPPPSAAASVKTRVGADGMDLGGTTRVHLDATPGTAGANTFEARIVDAGTEKFVDARRVTLQFTHRGSPAVGSSSLRMRRAGEIWLATGTNLSLDGRWLITVVVQSVADSVEVPLELATRCDATVLSAGPPVIYTQDLSGPTDQTYADPGDPGYNEIHFTFFDSTGNELAIPDTPVITAWRPGRRQREMPVRRYSSGHFIASGSFDRGRWRFDAAATPRGASAPLQACFEHSIG